MPRIDLNADLGEADRLPPSDVAVLASVTSANVACGFHAGNQGVMRAVAAAAHDRGAAVGAHVSYRDREGFGRRPVSVPRRQLVSDIVQQVAALTSAMEGLGGSVSYVKAHGALYHRAGMDDDTAAAVVEAVGAAGVGVLLAQAGSSILDRARRAGLVAVAEGFADRAYTPEATLVSRGEPGSVIDDPAVVAARAVSLATRGGIEAVDGTWVEVGCASICVHGDTPGAVVLAAGVRAALEAAGTTVRPFAR